MASLYKGPLYVAKVVAGMAKSALVSPLANATILIWPTSRYAYNGRYWSQ